MLALLLTSACSGAVNFAQAQSYCAAHPNGHVEIYVPDARVRRVLGIRESRSGLHEGFIIESNANDARVEDNADITGAIPLHRGEPISLLGQYECDDGVIHWTHHDPGMHHPTGYIEAGGRRYQ